MQIKDNVPSVDIVKNLLSSCFAMHENQVFANPGDEVIFEGTLDDLVQEVGREKLVDVSTWKLVREGLGQG